MFSVRKKDKMNEKWFNTLRFSKGYIFGSISIFLIPRPWFDQIAMAYYDIIESDAPTGILTAK